MRILLDEVVQTDYGQLDIGWGAAEDAEGGDVLDGFDGDEDRFFRGQLNGWVGAADPGGLYVVLARRSGGSSVRIELHDAEPPLDDAWEDVVEVSAPGPAGDEGAGWATWAGETGGPLDLPPGPYRVRVCARTRDAGADGELADGVVDSYLLQLWPADPAPDAVVRVGSEDARYWHREWGGRR